MTDEPLNAETALGQNVPLGDGLDDHCKCECGKGFLVWNKQGLKSCSDTLMKYEIQVGKKYPGIWKTYR